MTAAKIRGAARALLLAALLAGARADDVTWRECKQAGDGRGRVLARGQPDAKATSIQLKKCLITEINDGDFNGLPNLQNVYLHFNNIRHLDHAFFSAIPEVKFLFLDHNDLASVPSFGEHLVLPYLQILNLDSNLITALDNSDAFSSCEALLGLYLNNNQIEHMHPDVFQGLPNVKTLDLGGNKIKHIPNKMFALPSLNELHLENNHIKLVAPGAFHGTHFTFLSLSHNHLSYLPENIVFELTNSNSSPTMFFTFFDNPFQCACRKELIAAVKCVPRIDYEPHHLSERRCEEPGKTRCERLSEAEYNNKSYSAGQSLLA